MKQELTTQHNKRNFTSMLMEGSIYVFGMAFLNQDGVIAIFIDSTTGRMELVGLAVGIRILFSNAPQILIGPYIPYIKNLQRFIRLIMISTRSVPFWLALTLIFTPDSKFIFPIFILTYSILWFGQSILSIAWSDIFSRVVSNKNRGRLQGYQQVLGGLGGIGAGLIIKYLLDNPSLESNLGFGIIFLLAAIICTLSVIPMFFVTDKERPKATKKISYSTYFKNLRLLYNRKTDYRLMSKSMIANRVALLANPFIILVAKNLLELNSRIISNMIFTQIIGGLTGGLIWGFVSHRLNNRSVIIYNAITTSLCLLIVLSTILLNIPLITPLIMVIASLLGSINNLSWIGHLNYAIDIGEPHEKTDLVILNGILTIPVALISLTIGGITEYLGFTITFIFACFISIIGLFYSLKLTKYS